MVLKYPKFISNNFNVFLLFVIGCILFWYNYHPLIEGANCDCESLTSRIYDYEYKVIDELQKMLTQFKKDINNLKNNGP